MCDVNGMIYADNRFMLFRFIDTWCVRVFGVLIIV